MKKISWLALALVLVLAVGAASFAQASSASTNPELNAYVNSIQGVPRNQGDVGGELTKPIAQMLLGDRFNEANWELYKEGYFIGATWGGGGSSSDVSIPLPTATPAPAAV